MKTVKRASLPLLLIFMGVFACAVPTVPQVDQNAVSTSVAATLAVILQMTKDAGSSVALDSSATPTLAPGQPTFTATITPNPTSTATIAPLIPMISVSVATNCREGPGKLYDMVGALLVGQTVQVYARDPGSNYWYIRNPDDPREFCWVWGEYATLSGLTGTLPVYTPPPTPTPTYTATPSPGFDPSYGGLESCSGWWMHIGLHNTGTVTFKSVSITIKDTVTSTVITSVSDGFTDNTGCSTSVKRKSVAAGKFVQQSSPKLGYDPSGHKMRATVTLCSDTGLNGTCVTENLVFTP